MEKFVSERFWLLTSSRTDGKKEACCSIERMSPKARATKHNLVYFSTTMANIQPAAGRCLAIGFFAYLSPSRQRIGSVRVEPGKEMLLHQFNLLAAPISSLTTPEG